MNVWMFVDKTPPKYSIFAWLLLLLLCFPINRYVKYAFIEHHRIMANILMWCRFSCAIHPKTNVEISKTKFRGFNGGLQSNCSILIRFDCMWKSICNRNFKPKIFITFRRIKRSESGTPGEEQTPSILYYMGFVCMFMNR